MLIQELENDIAMYNKTKTEIQNALVALGNAKDSIAIINASNTFNHISKESNLLSYWNVPGSTSQKAIIDVLGTLATDLKDENILSIYNELSSKAVEKIAELDAKISSATSQLDELKLQALN